MKNIKLVFFNITLFFFKNLIPLQGQIILSVEGGISSNKLNTNLLSNAFIQNKRGLGYYAGFSCEKKINSFVGVQIGIEYLQKRSSIERNSLFRGIYTLNTYNYVQLPLKIISNYKRKKFNLYFSIGFYGTYWTSGRFKGTIPNIFDIRNSINPSGQIEELFQFASFNQNYEFDERRDNRYEFGYTLGSGIVFKISKISSLFLNYSFYKSLNDIQKKYMINQMRKFNQTSVISIGYDFYLHPKKRIK